MLQEINTSLGPIKEDFDRYLAWDHRKSRLEEDLYSIDSQLDDPTRFRVPLFGAKWMDSLFDGLLLEELFPEIERLRHARQALKQQIALLDRQMTQAGDPRELYHELLELKQDWLIETGHRAGEQLRQLNMEIGELEEMIKGYSLIMEVQYSAHQSVQTLWLATRKLYDTRLFMKPMSLFSRRHKAAYHRVRRSMPLANSLLIQLGEQMKKMVDYEALPPELQAGHFFQFSHIFREQLVLRGAEATPQASPMTYLGETLGRLENLVVWVSRNQDAHSQRVRFLRHKQERIIRQAD